MISVSRPERADRPSSLPPRKAPPWGERLVGAKGRASRHYRRQKPSPVVIYRLTEHLEPGRWFTTRWSFPSSHGAERSVQSRWLAFFDEEDNRILVPRFFSYGQPRVGKTPFLPHLTAEDRLTQALTASHGAVLDDGLDTKEFNINVAVWSALSEMLKAAKRQNLNGWIVGWSIAIISWALGGFDGLIKSAIALAVTNSVTLFFGDIKRGQFNATRALSDLLQVPGYLGVIAIGTFIDFGLDAHVMRFLMASLIVIPICSWKSFRELVFLLNLRGLDQLIDQILDAFTNFINQNRIR
jgi:hypothetical protein